MADFSKRTPGPWEAVAVDSCKFIVARDARFHESTRTICVIEVPNYAPDRRADEPQTWETEDEDIANTEWIAYACNTVEAKDQRIALLQELLRECVARYDNVGDLPEVFAPMLKPEGQWLIKARAALADKEVDK